MRWRASKRRGRSPTSSTCGRAGRWWCASPPTRCATGSSCATASAAFPPSAAASSWRSTAAAHRSRSAMSAIRRSCAWPWRSAIWSSAAAIPTGCCASAAAPRRADDAPPERAVNLPNLITLGRLLCVPLAIWLVLSDELGAAFWLFVAAGLSDAIDGFIAKRFDQRSRLGALLDPLADKALLVSMFVTLGVAGHLATWLVILVVFRDVLIIGGFLLITALAQTMRWEPLFISKL